jgi:Ca-activated chloride channel family protein
MSPRPAEGQVSVDVDVPWEVRSALAPGFELDEERIDSGRLELGWESPSGWTPDANFRLYLSGGEGLVDTRLLAHRESGEDGYFSLLFAPGGLDESIARDVVLVLDRSGSMEGEKMEQAIAAAEYVLANLGPDDRFAVVDFSRYIRTFGDRLRPASDAVAGIDYVRDIRAGGTPNIAGALERGMEFLDGERPGTVIFLTDGLATVGIESAEGILESEQARPAHAAVRLRRRLRRGHRLGRPAPGFVGGSRHVAPERTSDRWPASGSRPRSSPTSVSPSTAWTPGTWLRPRSPASSPATRPCWPAASTGRVRPPSP